MGTSLSRSHWHTAKWLPWNCKPRGGWFTRGSSVVLLVIRLGAILTLATFDLANPREVIAVTDNEAQFVTQSVPSTLRPGETTMVAITLRNTGSTTWISAGNYHLGSQNPQDNLRWGLNRVYLADAEAIAPGQQKTFTFHITAPNTAGTYNFQWRMVQDGLEWFGAYTPNVVITVAPPAATDRKSVV